MGSNEDIRAERATKSLESIATSAEVVAVSAKKIAACVAQVCTALTAYLKRGGK